MNENAKQWVAALRSGEFRQIAAHLRDPDDGDGHCVLGVACELHRRMADGEWEEVAFGEWGWRLAYHYLGAEGHLPTAVMCWLDLSSRTGRYVLPDGTDGSLMRDNDDGKMPFNQLADLIESEPEGLFRE